MNSEPTNDSMLKPGDMTIPVMQTTLTLFKTPRYRTRHLALQTKVGTPERSGELLPTTLVTVLAVVGANVLVMGSNRVIGWGLRGDFKHV